MNTKILFVDDDKNILSGYKRALRKQFEIITALSGAEGISIIENSKDEFTIIISDMRMPEMNGIEFLKRAKEITPNSVRVMLTGNADQQTAIEAVNEGSIFRFLNKPCHPETLAKVLRDGIEQYRLITAEKELLNQTLNKSLQVMVEILSLVNPTAFSRTSRIKRLAGNLAKHYKLKNPWEIEIAAMLSQIGCVTVPEETLKKVSNAETLNAAELRLYHQHPQIGHDLIAKIPRMNSVARMIAGQTSQVTKEIDRSKELNRPESIELGSRILKVVTDFDKLLEAGNSHHESFEKLLVRKDIYDFGVLRRLQVIVDKFAEQFISLDIDIYRLEPGMIVDEPVYTNKNILLLARGQEITYSLIISLKSFAQTGAIANKIKICVPKQEVSPVKPDEIKNIAVPAGSPMMNPQI